MRNLHRYVFLVFTLVSVALVAWAIAAGWNAPDSAKIANSTPLVQQFDADGNAASPVQFCSKRQIHKGRYNSRFYFLDV